MNPDAGEGVGVNSLELEQAGGQVGRLAIASPLYHNVDTKFYSSMCAQIARYSAATGHEPILLNMGGPYAAQNMRSAMRILRERDDWDRVLVVEQDMMLPRNAFFLHALLTPEDEIVGSVYFQHAPPFHINAMMRNPDEPEKMGFPNWEGVKFLLDNPGLHPCGAVGLGCTSIARDVVMKWDPDIPMFLNGFSPEAKDDAYANGEVSHDVYFCQEAEKQGFKIWVLTSCVCRHITYGEVGPLQVEAYYRQELMRRASEKGILLPNNRAGRRAASRNPEITLVKS